MDFGRFDSIEQAVAALRPEGPVLCMDRRVIAESAAEFLDEFPGRVLYAVKCNDHPTVLRWLHEAGIRDFDTASIDEVAHVKRLFPDASCCLNHPVKTRDAIRSSYREFGVRDYVVDCHDELRKLGDELDARDVVVQVRLATRPGHAKYDFSSKFGASVEEAVDILRGVSAMGMRPAVSFHVGSQCTAPSAFEAALRDAADAVGAAGVSPAYINVGGGFPARYQGVEAPPPADFFKVIAGAASSREELKDRTLVCEPGRGLVAMAGTLVVGVVLRRGSRLYVNDGAYGCLGEANYIKMAPAARLVRPGAGWAAERAMFQLFGPTCDSFDALDHPLMLPSDVREGDWIALEGLGAYSNVLANGFNGFGGAEIVEIG